MKFIPMLAAALTAGAVGCGDADPEGALANGAPSTVGSAPTVPACRVADVGQPLPGEVRESSGLAPSRRAPDLFWTLNDAGNDPDLFAVDGSGRLVERVRVTGAELKDWEALESGPCDAGTCLYVGDIGDNDAERERITVYRVAEPERGASESERAQALHARFPDGPRDAESLFALPGGDLFVVTKGRRGPVELYRFPSPQEPGETAALELVRQIFPEPENEEDRVTGAASSPDGRWVGIRTYRSLFLYPAAQLVGGGAAEPTVVDLGPLRQQQGESVAISEDGTVWLTSEAGSEEGHPRLSRLQCSFPAG